jgi:adenylylsulfate kinase
MQDREGRIIPGVALTGTIGVGKTALAEALSELLHSNDIRHALIDVDWLGQVYPPPELDKPYSFDLAFKNLAAIAPNFDAAGANYFVIALTLTSQEELSQLRRALPQVSITVCRVNASPETIAQRIRRRELGSLRDDFLSRTDALAREIEQAGVQDFFVVNDHRPVSEVAEELLNRLNWE